MVWTLERDISLYFDGYITFSVVWHCIVWILFLSVYWNFQLDYYSHDIYV